MYALHPSVIHFPIVLLIFTLLFELLAIVVKREHFLQTAYILLIISTVSCIAASFTGEQAEESIEIKANFEEILENHETLGSITTYLCILLLVIKTWFKIKKLELERIHWIFIVLLSACVFFVIITAYYGGKLVFEYGVGLK